MAISRIGSAAANATSVTLPSHQAGDIILICAYRDGSVVSPSLPSGWSSLSSAGASTNAMIAAVKIAASNAETSGTWTNATQIIAIVYRSSNQVLVSRVVANGAASTTINYAALAGNTVNARYVGFAGYRTNDTDIEVAPTGMSNITSTAGASTGELAAHDTGDTLQDGWASTNYVLTAGSSSAYRSLMVELRDTGVAMSGGGITGPRFGMHGNGPSFGSAA